MTYSAGGRLLLLGRFILKSFCGSVQSLGTFLIQGRNHQMCGGVSRASEIGTEYYYDYYVEAAGLLQSASENSSSKVARAKS